MHHKFCCDTRYRFNHNFFIIIMVMICTVYKIYTTLTRDTVLHSQIQYLFIANIWL